MKEYRYRCDFCGEWAEKVYGLFTDDVNGIVLVAQPASEVRHICQECVDDIARFATPVSRKKAKRK